MTTDKLSLMVRVNTKWVHALSNCLVPRFHCSGQLFITLDHICHQCEGPNESSMSIWLKSVQRFPKTFHRQTKSHRQHQKQNLPQFTACSKDCSNSN